MTGLAIRVLLRKLLRCLQSNFRKCENVAELDDVHISEEVDDRQPRLEKI